MEKRKRGRKKGGKSTAKSLPGVLNLLVAVCVSVYDFITDFPVYMGAGICFAYYKIAKKERTFSSLLFESRAASLLVFVAVFVTVIVFLAIPAVL